MSKDRRLAALRRQVGRLERRLLHLDRRSNRYSWLRLAIVVAGAVACAVLFLLDARVLLLATLAATVLAFSLAVRLHRRVDRAIARIRILLEIKRAQIARMTLDWDQIPAPAAHAERPLEFDLDLVGPYSLHHLLDTAVSEPGSQRLRSWLANPDPDPARALGRQHLVQELAPRWLFRHRLTLAARLAARLEEKWQPEWLLEWLNRPAAGSPVFPRWLRLLIPLALLNVLLFALNVLGPLPPLWQATIVLYAVLSLVASRSIGELFHDAAHLRDSLEQLTAVFRELETFSYRHTPHLSIFCAPFLEPAECPSRYLARANRIVAATGVRGNPAVWLILNALFPWDIFFAQRLDDTKRTLARRLPGWLDVWSDLEALGSLANLIYLNPHFTFPEIATGPADAASPVFSARHLGHPLIPDGEKVCNDFAADQLGQLFLFTGSNMSGKSTFLRTVGINLCLAYAGGPVDAQAFFTIPFRLYSCMRISDSITDGISYFYGEVKCLKGLLAQLERDGSSPLFYFIDEIFRGTNNRERLIGSRAYIRALAGKRGVGLLSTHDLELVSLSEEIPVIRNHHFTDEVVDGRMVFDFTLRHGPSPTTNALKIMKMEGLPVEIEIRDGKLDPL